ncbi:MAG: hypothetical protein JWL95_2429 [Gemmatimonadetes bacterium]|nr:hypothetical protein [Gemmatimonadota bacterium]
MTDDELLGLLADAAHADGEPRFDAGFADRVSARVTARATTRVDHGGSLSHALVRQARRVLPALLAASLALTAWNWWSVRDTSDSSLASALGLQPVTFASALANGSLIGAEELQ